MDDGAQIAVSFSFRLEPRLTEMVLPTFRVNLHTSHILLPNQECLSNISIDN